jgi:membrane protease YdiL (CAAX protease family)
LSDRILRCHGCGVLNGAYRRECASCGTLLAGAPEVGAVPVPVPAGEQARTSLSRVGWLFGVSLGLGGAGLVAGRLDLDGALVDVTLMSVLALVAAVAAVAGRAALAPLLATTGGWRGLAWALGGVGFLVAFGALYFGALARLGFHMQQVTDAYVTAGWPRWSMFLLVSVAPGLVEEVMFRGYAMDRLEGLLTPREALVVQAALFSVLHLGPIIFPSHFVIGLVLGVVRRRARSLYPSMAVHMTWNGLIVWAELAGRSFP